MKTICIMCPLGCPLEISEENGKITVVGNTCKRGEKYGVDEFSHPSRVLTTLVRISGGGIAAVKTSCAIPKEKLFDVAAAVEGLYAPCDVNVGDVVLKNPIGLDCDIVVTGINK